MHELHSAMAWHERQHQQPHHISFSTTHCVLSVSHDMITTSPTSSSTTNLGGAQPLSLRFLCKPPLLSLTLFFPSHSAYKGIAVSSTPCKPRVRCEKEVRNGNQNGVEEENEEVEREVQCEVHVVSWRERRVKAEISVNADIESIWNALTDYEHLADFIPNLVWR